MATAYLTSFRRVAAAYFEGFDGGLAPNWTPKLGAWTVEGDEYRNIDNLLFSSSVYDGAQLPTDFDLFTDVYLSWGNTGNRAGLLFNYRSANDFYEVRLNASGTAVLSEVIGGVRRIIRTASYPEAGVRRWAVVYARKVSARTHIEINGVRVFEVLLPKHTGGNAGVFSSWNMARFDNVLIATAIPAVDLRYAAFNTSSREGFTPLSGTWSSASGYLRSSANQQSSIALYTPLALGDIYQISARVYSEWTGGTSNQSGFVYDYVDSNNYREALYNVATPAHAGAAILSDVVNGVRREVARQELPSQSSPQRDLRLTLLRENDLTIFSGVFRLHVRQPHPPVPVRVGLLTRWNLARYDDAFVYDLSTQ